MPDTTDPRLPPTPVVRGLFRARSGLRRLHDALAPPQGVVAERMFGVAELKLIAEVTGLGVPEALEAGPLDTARLATAVGADRSALGRVLRFLAARGWFRVSTDDTYDLNGRSRLLLADHPDSLRDWIRFMGADWYWEIWNGIGETLRTGRPAVESVTGRPFFEYVHDENPEAGRTFDGAMSSLSALVGPLLPGVIPLDRFGSVCDVGGGTGLTLAALLNAAPHLRGELFDRPEVVADTSGLAGVDAARWTATGGDFFAGVPLGHDLYLLKAIVHDWSDDDAVRILTVVRQAMGASGRVVVVENRLEPGAHHDIPSATDMVMLALTDGGRERTQTDFERLFAAAGFAIEAQAQLPILVWAFTLRPDAIPPAADAPTRRADGGRD